VHRAKARESQTDAQGAYADREDVHRVHLFSSLQVEDPAGPVAVFDLAGHAAIYELLKGWPIFLAGGIAASIYLADALSQPFQGFEQGG
jgi:hypothetical protein